MRMVIDPLQSEEKSPLSEVNKRNLGRLHEGAVNVVHILKGGKLQQKKKEVNFPCNNNNNIIIYGGSCDLEFMEMYLHYV